MPAKPHPHRVPEEVPGRGLEPLLLAEPDPKSGASANFATPAGAARIVTMFAARAMAEADEAR